jgi:hypothetical protein
MLTVITITSLLAAIAVSLEMTGAAAVLGLLALVLAGHFI